jgi:hypothetical protein
MRCQTPMPIDGRSMPLPALGREALFRDRLWLQNRLVQAANEKHRTFTAYNSKESGIKGGGKSAY